MTNALLVIDLQNDYFAGDLRIEDILYLEPSSIQWKEMQHVDMSLGDVAVHLGAQRLHATRRRRLDRGEGRLEVVEDVF